VVTGTNDARNTFYPDFVDWRDQNTVFERLAAYASASLDVTGKGEPERIDGELVSADYFPLLGLLSGSSSPLRPLAPVLLEGR